MTRRVGAGQDNGQRRGTTVAADEDKKKTDSAITMGNEGKSTEPPPNEGMVRSPAAGKRKRDRNATLLSSHSLLPRARNRRDERGGSVPAMGALEFCAALNGQDPADASRCLRQFTRIVRDERRRALLSPQDDPMEVRGSATPLPVDGNSAGNGTSSDEACFNSSSSSSSSEDDDDDEDDESYEAKWMEDTEAYNVPFVGTSRVRGETGANIFVKGQWPTGFVTAYLRVSPRAVELIPGTELVPPRGEFHEVLWENTRNKKRQRKVAGGAGGGSSATISKKSKAAALALTKRRSEKLVRDHMKAVSELLTVAMPRHILIEDMRRAQRRRYGSCIPGDEEPVDGPCSPPASVRPVVLTAVQDLLPVIFEQIQQGFRKAPQDAPRRHDVKNNGGEQEIAKSPRDRGKTSSVASSIVVLRNLALTSVGAAREVSRGLSLLSSQTLVRALRHGEARSEGSGRPRAKQGHLDATHDIEDDHEDPSRKRDMDGTKDKPSFMVLSSRLDVRSALIYLATALLEISDPLVTSSICSSGAAQRAPTEERSNNKTAGGNLSNEGAGTSASSSSLRGLAYLVLRSELTTGAGIRLGGSDSYYVVLGDFLSAIRKKLIPPSPYQRKTSCNGRSNRGATWLPRRDMVNLLGGQTLDQLAHLALSAPPLWFAGKRLRPLSAVLSCTDSYEIEDVSPLQSAGIEARRLLFILLADPKRSPMFSITRRPTKQIMSGGKVVAAVDASIDYHHAQILARTLTLWTRINGMGPETREFIVHCLSAAPSLVPHFFKTAPVHFGESEGGCNSIDQIASIAFLTHVVTETPTIWGSLGPTRWDEFKGKVTDSRRANTVVLPHILPSALGRNVLSNSLLLSKSPLVVAEAIKLVISILRRIKRLLDDIQASLSSPTTGALAESMTDYIVEAAERRLPDMQVLLKVRSKFNPFGGDTTQNLAVNSLLTIHLLDMVRLYRQCLPRALFASTFDWTRLLPSKEIFVAAPPVLQLRLFRTLQCLSETNKNRTSQLLASSCCEGDGIRYSSKSFGALLGIHCASNNLLVRRAGRELLISILLGAAGGRGQSSANNGKSSLWHEAWLWVDLTTEDVISEMQKAYDDVQRNAMHYRIAAVQSWARLSLSHPHPPPLTFSPLLTRSLGVASSQSSTASSSFIDLVVKVASKQLLCETQPLALAAMISHQTSCSDGNEKLSALRCYANDIVRMRTGNIKGADLRSSLGHLGREVFGESDRLDRALCTLVSGPMKRESSDSKDITAKAKNEVLSALVGGDDTLVWSVVRKVLHLFSLLPRQPMEVQRTDSGETVLYCILWNALMAASQKDNASSLEDILSALSASSCEGVKCCITLFLASWATSPRGLDARRLHVSLEDSLALFAGSTLGRTNGSSCASGTGSLAYLVASISFGSFPESVQNRVRAGLLKEACDFAPEEFSSIPFLRIIETLAEVFGSTKSLSIQQRWASIEAGCADVVSGLRRAVKLWLELSRSPQPVDSMIESRHLRSSLSNSLAMWFAETLERSSFNGTGAAAVAVQALEFSPETVFEVLLTSLSLYSREPNEVGAKHADSSREHDWTKECGAACSKFYGALLLYDFNSFSVPLLRYICSKRDVESSELSQSGCLDFMIRRVARSTNVRQLFFSEVAGKNASASLILKSVLQMVEHQSEPLRPTFGDEAKTIAGDACCALKTLILCPYTPRALKTQAIDRLIAVVQAVDEKLPDKLVVFSHNIMAAALEVCVSEGGNTSIGCEKNNEDSRRLAQLTTALFTKLISILPRSLKRQSVGRMEMLGPLVVLEALAKMLAEPVKFDAVMMSGAGDQMQRVIVACLRRGLGDFEVDPGVAAPCLLFLRKLVSATASHDSSLGFLRPRVLDVDQIHAMIASHSQFATLISYSVPDLEFESGNCAEDIPEEVAAGRCKLELLSLLLACVSIRKGTIVGDDKATLILLMQVYNGSMSTEDRIVRRLLYLYEMHYRESGTEEEAIYFVDEFRWHNRSARVAVEAVGIGVDKTLDIRGETEKRWDWLVSGLSTGTVRATLRNFPSDETLAPRCIPEVEVWLEDGEGDGEHEKEPVSDDDGGDSGDDETANLTIGKDGREKEEVPVERRRRRVNFHYSSCPDKRYDPSFLLPIFLSAFEAYQEDENRALDHDDAIAPTKEDLDFAKFSRTFCDRGGLAFTLAALSCKCHLLRQVCAGTLALVLQSIQTKAARSLAEWKERPQLAMLLESVQRGLCCRRAQQIARRQQSETGTKLCVPMLPTVSALFIARFSLVLSHPGDTMYGAANAFFLRLSGIGAFKDTSRLPGFMSLYCSTSDEDGHARRERLWALQLLKDGMADGYCYQVSARCHAPSLLLSAFDSLASAGPRATDDAERQAILEVLKAMVVNGEGLAASHLVGKTGLVSWMRGILSSRSFHASFPTISLREAALELLISLAKCSKRTLQGEAGRSFCDVGTMEIAVIAGPMMDLFADTVDGSLHKTVSSFTEGRLNFLRLVIKSLCAFQDALHASSTMPSLHCGISLQSACLLLSQESISSELKLQAVGALCELPYRNGDEDSPLVVHFALTTLGILLDNRDELACLGTHGTATSVLKRVSSLSSSSGKKKDTLKGNADVLEKVLSCRSLVPLPECNIWRSCVQSLMPRDKCQGKGDLFALCRGV